VVPMVEAMTALRSWCECSDEGSLSIVVAVAMAFLSGGLAPLAPLGIRKIAGARFGSTARIPFAHPARGRAEWFSSAFRAKEQRNDKKVALLAKEATRQNDAGRVGIALRRLRALLPDEARGRGYGAHLLHRHRLPALRRRDLPLQGLQEPQSPRARLPAAHAEARGRIRL